MNDQERIRQAFERNKRKAKANANARHSNSLATSTIWKLALSLGAVVTVFLALPGQFNSFVDAVASLKQKTVELWLQPERWEGVFHDNPQAYVDVVDLELSGGVDLYLQLTYVASEGDFDGEFVSRHFCAQGWPYTNLLVRGRQNFLDPNKINLEVFDIVGGQTVSFGDLTAIMERPVVEIQGWPDGDVVRLALVPNVSEVPVSRLCSQAG